MMIAAVLAFITVALAQPGGDDGIIDYPALTEVVAADPSLATLAAALAAASNASYAPFGPFDDGNYTLFAPENDAFDPALVEKLLQPGYILHLQELLKFHVTMPTVERVLSRDFTDGMELTMLTEDTITIRVAAGTVTVSTETNSIAIVIAVDNLASNGNVHIVDTVLVPKFLATDLLTLAGELEDYSTLVELLDKSGVISFIPQGVDFTIFAPNNAALEKLGTEALETLKNDTVALNTILANHVLFGVVPSVLLSDGQTETAVGTMPLMFSVGDTVMVNGATVVDPDVLASNGIVHGIDTVLLEDMMPPDTNTTTMPPDDADAPTLSPVMSPSETTEPTLAPVVQASPPVRTGPTVEDTFSGVSISFVGATEMSVQEVANFETITEEWFTGYYTKREQSTSIDVEDMTTRIRLTDQTVIMNDNSISTLLIVYEQGLSYIALPGAQNAEFYISLPFSDGEENRDYIARLVSNLDAFPADMVPSTVSPPIIMTSESAPSGGDSNGLPIGIIAGVCVAVGILLSLAFGFRWYQNRKRRNSEEAGSSGPGERSDPTLIAQEVVAAPDSIVFPEEVLPVNDTEQQQTDKEVLPRFKDQVQPVVPPTHHQANIDSPIVQNAGTINDRRPQTDPPTD